MMNGVTQSDYEQAVKHPEYRQEFLDKIDLGETAKYVKEVKYVPIQFIRYVAMFNHASILTLLYVKGTKSKIKVFPRSFGREPYECLDDFLLTLIDHEGQHAKDFYELSDNNIMEFRAYMNQIKNMNSRNISESMRAYILRGASKYCIKKQLSEELRMLLTSITYGKLLKDFDESVK